ncbi:hypothetical protein MWU59_10440 [Flavobacteriaceae bacterium F08102]|nr:hypothetical protein [Flavobacteriaceae bacterium F08102]
MKNIFLAVIIAFPFLTFGQKENLPILPKELQIKTAVLAAPVEFRENATVLGYNQKGEFVTLRKGTNGFICLAPNYKTPRNYASYCYPESLEPLMKRGRELEAMGKKKEKNEIRAKEYKEGKLHIPKGPTIMYAYYGSYENLNQETGEIANAKRRYVIYLPESKASDFGLSNKPNNLGMPWLMDEGTYKSHIMITPPHQHGK